MKLRMAYSSWLILFTLIGFETVQYLTQYLFEDVIGGRITSLVISVVSILVSFGILQYFLVKPISQLIERTQAIINGDVSQTVQVDAKGDLEVLARTINNMTESLRNLIIKLQNDSNELANFSSSLSESVNLS